MSGFTGLIYSLDNWHQVWYKTYMANVRIGKTTQGEFHKAEVRAGGVTGDGRMGAVVTTMQLDLENGQKVFVELGVEEASHLAAALVTGSAQAMNFRLIEQGKERVWEFCDECGVPIAVGDPTAARYVNNGAKHHFRIECADCAPK